MYCFSHLVILFFRSMQLSENRVANGKRNQSSLRSSPDAVVYEPANCDREIVSKLAGVEAKIRDLEKRQRRDGTKAVINHENVKQLQTKISTLEDQILEYKQVQSGYLVPDPHLSWDTGKSITQHPSETKRDALFSQSKVGELVADNAGIKQRMEAVSMNAKRACRSLSGGLSDVQLATVELLRWTDQVHTAFGVMSEKLFFMKNICPHLKSSYVVREAMQDECTAYIDYDT